MKTPIRIIAAALLLSASSTAYAEIAVSGNDGKQLRPGEAPSTRTADNVSVIDLGRYPPKILGSVETPVSMIGAPAAVAVAPDESFALVTGHQRVGATGELESIGHISVIDLTTPAAPKVVQTLQVAPGTAGVTINRAGTLALVAINGDDTIAVFSISGKRLTPAGKVQLPAKSRPTDVVFAPDGKSALVVAQTAGKLIGLDVNGTNVTVSSLQVDTGVQPYGASFSPDGKFAYNTNLGGRARPPGSPPPAAGGPPRVGTISGVDLTTRAVNSVEVGQTPEHIILSRDGKYAAVVVANGSAAAPGASGYHPYGLLQIYSVNGAKLARVAEAHSGAWCQGAVFSNDARTVLLQCAMNKEIEVYRFDGKSLTQDPAATLKFTARPGALATATSR
jgi:DNA-binding beta-propeller fold protein YncE